MRVRTGITLTWLLSPTDNLTMRGPAWWASAGLGHLRRHAEKGLL